MDTKLIRSIQSLGDALRGGVVAIGNFDGVHLGHQQLLKRVVATATKLSVPSIVITFEPHPLEFFGERTIPRLSNLREKFSALGDCGIDYVVILTFNQKLAQLSASNFVTDILHHYLHPRLIIVGEDFRFGKNRQGDVDLLKALGKQLGFEVEVMPDFKLGDERVSSTQVRKALAADDHQMVERLLGHPYFLMGKVMRGDQRGRKLGFPTANIFLKRDHLPIRGVYFVYVSGIGTKSLPGVANIGVRPTVDGTRSSLEVHLLDFDEDIYGSVIKVSFLKKLREEIRFPNIELLQKQIAEDVKKARDYFTTTSSI